MKKLILFIFLSILLLSFSNINAQNRVLSFDGVDDYIDVQPSVPSFSSVITIEAWIKTTASKGENDIICWGGQNADNVQFRTSGGKLQLGLDDYGVGWQVVENSQLVNTGEWIHIAAVKNGTAVSLYVNGILDGSGTLSASLSLSSFVIGRYGGSNYYYDGFIEEIRIWSDVRTLSEIQDNMNKQLVGNEAGLVAYYKLNETTGTTANDSQSSGTYDGTLSGFTFDTGSVVESVWDNIVYVNHAASGTDNGTSWANAYTSLQTAMENTSSGYEIWVAKGTYKPSKEVDGTTDTQRKYSFEMTDGVQMYGGFTGTETAVSERTDYSHSGANETILSGDHNGNDVITGSGETLSISNNTDNSYHVIFHYDTHIATGEAVLDGFTVTGGNANLAGNPWDDGGGLYNNSGQTPTLNNCYFVGNSALDNGGAMMNVNSDGMSITNCTFDKNYATDDGGAISNYSSDALITNCLFYGNRAISNGGVVYNYSASAPNFTSCTITENSAVSGGGIYNDENSDISISNTIVYGNTITGVGPQIRNYDNSNLTLSYSDIEGGISTGIYSTVGGSTIDSGGNIETDPKFIGNNLNANHPYAITGLSPCADVGSDAANTETYDIRGSGFGRKLSKTDGSTGTIDIGAYEYKYNSDWLYIPIFVDIDASGGSNNGSTWANAYTSFQSALSVASSGNYIWVAEGTYHPSVDENGEVNVNTRLHTFQMKNEVEIYGGFAGTETKTSQRSDFGVGGVNEAILSGDILGNDAIVGVGATLQIWNKFDNCYNVFYHPNGTNLTGTAVLDGFTLRGASADGSYPHNVGGGMYNKSSSPSLTNCTLTGNYAVQGGGMYNDSSSPNLTNCTISSNLTTTSDGGGMYNANSSSPVLTNCNIAGNSSRFGGGMYNTSSSTPTITNCTISDNAATNGNGGGIYNHQVSPNITNSIFTGNTASTWGGGINNAAASPNIISCTLLGNTAQYGGGICNQSSSSPIIKNTILWDNTATSNSTRNEVYNITLSTPTFSHCDIKGSGGSASWNVSSFGTDGGNNIDSDPLFVGSGDHPYLILGDSPCADVGSDVANSETYDIRGEGYSRKLSKTDGSTGTIDMGAYEYLFGTDPANPTTTWTGAVDNDWTNAANWDNGVPAGNLNVVIPNGNNVEFSGAVNSDNLEIEAGGTLTISSAGSLTSGGNVTIKSSSSASGSLILSGNYSGSDITYQRYMLANQWHMFGSPLTGQSINSFLTDANNAIIVDGSGNYSMKHYTESPEAWSANYTTATSGNIALGSAYVVKRSTEGAISLIGQPNNTTVNSTITRGDFGWNLLGNPFTSAIAAKTGTANGDNNLITVNTSILDENYAAIYVWEENTLDPTNTNNYKFINQTGVGSTLAQDYLQVGQGFFIKATVGGGSFTMTPAMQSHQTTVAFKASESDWTSITLNAEISNAKASTGILYRDDMTKGLDVGFDAGLLNSYPAFALYTRLLEDNGVDFGLQCLPTDFDNLIIPIGLDAKAGEIVSFSTDAINLSEQYAVILEDRVSNTFTSLSDEGVYNILLTDDIDGIGRFFVHTTFKSALGFDDLSVENAFQVFSSSRDNQVVIRGEVAANTTAKIFSITGKLMEEISLKQSTENRISFNKESGIYIIQIANTEGAFVQKFSWVK